MTGTHRRAAVIGQLLGYVRTWLAAWAEAWSNRRSFWLQVAVMVVNDLVWIGFWVLFFRQIGQLRGWDIEAVLILWAVLTTSGGIVLGLFANSRSIASLVSSGGIDEALILPTATLPHLLLRRVETSNVGDVVFGISLFLIAGDPTPQRLAIFGFGVMCSALILVGFIVAVGSTSFFFGRSDAGDLGFQALLLTSSYPIDIFGSTTRVLLYTVLPAGFVSSAPARLLTEFNGRWAAGLAGVAILVFAAGWATFTLGLRRYTSGAAWVEA
ncbi:MAG: ABC transporter permease [Acidimicrobiales bacterium]